MNDNKAIKSIDTQVNWDELRESYFNECVDDKKVCLAPHDLFEWFKRELLEYLR